MELERDKMLHILVVFDIASVLAPWSVLVAVLASLAAIFGKELYDKTCPDKHSAEWADVRAGLVGLGLALIVYALTCWLPGVCQGIIIAYLVGVTAAWYTRDKLHGANLIAQDSWTDILFSWTYVIPGVLVYLFEK